jgi:hypothetical protein
LFTPFDIEFYRTHETVFFELLFPNYKKKLLQQTGIRDHPLVDNLRKVFGNSPSAPNMIKVFRDPVIKILYLGGHPGDGTGFKNTIEFQNICASFTSVEREQLIKHLRKINLDELILP